jgi:uncharacterized membrane protein
LHSTVVSTLLSKILLVATVALWAFHLSQRRLKEASERKRIATLSLTVVVIGAWVACWIFSVKGIDDLYLIAVAVLAAEVVVWQRRLMLPYRLRCVHCGKPMKLTRVLNYDSNTCEACESRGTEGVSS